MKPFRTLAMSLLCLLPMLAEGGAMDEKLEGTWIETEQFGNFPRTVLRFRDGSVSFDTPSGEHVTAPYKIGKSDRDGFSVSYEYRHMVKRGNGRIIERREFEDLYYHVEDGKPVLSEDIFEADGRGRIFGGEFLREGDFVEGFESRMKKRLNSTKPVKTYRE